MLLITYVPISPHFHIPGAIAGIVFGVIIALVVIAVAIAIIIAIVVYKIRTGNWFKVKHQDEEKVTVDFDQGLLMEDEEKQNSTSSLKRKFSWPKDKVSHCVHITCMLHVVIQSFKVLQTNKNNLFISIKYLHRKLY